MTEKLTEKARAATCPENRGCLPVSCVCVYVEDLADRIEELEARLAGVDAGTHVIVPVEPTEKQFEFIESITILSRFEATVVYAGMIHAAQEKDL